MEGPHARTPMSQPEQPLHPTTYPPPSPPPHLPLADWQWVSVTLSLAPVRHSPPNASSQHGHDDEDARIASDGQLARLLAAQWAAQELAVLSSNPLTPASFASATPPPPALHPPSPSPAIPPSSDYAALAHLPADQVFADEGPLFDLHARFQYYNARYFHSALSACEARWSTRMSLCAGQCHYHPATGYCSVRLSQPLLQFRPKQDCVNTLLHEMIHAYMFVTDGNDDHDGHGPKFHEWMHKLNEREPGAKITVFHTFKDEVNAQRKHVWQCSGPCKGQPPFFGLVKRAMNRPPQKADWWFERHAKECGGTYVKIAGPEPKPKAKGEKRKVKIEDGVEGEGAGTERKKKRKVEEEGGKGSIDRFLVKEGRLVVGPMEAVAAADVAKDRSSPEGNVVDLTLDSGSDDDEVVFVRAR